MPGIQYQITHVLDELASDGLVHNPELVIRRGNGGDVTRDDAGWPRYTWHVLLTRRDECMSWTWHTGTAALDISSQHGLPKFPTVERILEGIVSDAEDARQNESLADFAEAYGYDDVRKAVTVWDALKRQYADLERVFPGATLTHFLDTYREQD